MRSKALFCTFYLIGGLIIASAQPKAKAWKVVTDAALNAKNPDHRQQAVAAIAAIGPAPEAVDFLEGVLHNDSDATVRQMAAAALDQMHATAAIPALQRALDDPSGEVAFSAAKALWDLGDPTGEATFEEILTHEKKAGPGLVGAKMSEAKRTFTDPKKMAFMGAKEATGALFGPLSMGFTVAKVVTNDGGAQGRALAAEYMAKTCDAHSVQLLKWSLQNDDNWLVKAAAARGLGKCGDADDIPALEKYLGDSHEPLKYQAAAAIVRLSLKEPSAGATASAAMRP